MSNTESQAQKLYQELEKFFDRFYYLNRQDQANHLAGELETLCRKSAQKVKALVKEYGSKSTE
jgi:hypothetical protein